ncbi:MAG: membrane protease subunit HflC [Rhodothermales bacterium]|jgi:membrane protease subunit HflC
MTDEQKAKLKENKGMVALVGIVCLVFLISLFTFQVRATEYGYVLRFGNPVRVAQPGLGFKMPSPIETVWRADRRIHCFEGAIGELEETFTKDGKNIIVTAYVCWRIADDPGHIKKYLQRFQGADDAFHHEDEHGEEYAAAAATPGSTERPGYSAAEKRLTDLLRSTRSSVVSQYNFNDLINIDPGAVKLDTVEADMLAAISSSALEQFGIEVTRVGFTHIGLPAKVSEAVFARMKAERGSKQKDILSRGEAEAREIRAKAESEKRTIIAKAEANAKRSRGQADQEAAKHYDTFAEEPELAEFLVEIEALKQMSEGATLFFNPDTPPFTALKKLQQLKQEQKATK